MVRFSGSVCAEGRLGEACFLLFDVDGFAGQDRPVNITAARIPCRRRGGTVMAAVAAARCPGRVFRVFLQAVVGFERNDVDEKRDEYADQGIDHAIDGETRDADIVAVSDRHAQKSDTGDVGQCVFAHEFDKEFERRDGQRMFAVRRAGKGESRFFLDDFRQIHQRDDTGRYQQIGPDRTGFQRNATDEKQDAHTCETADQRAYRPVQADAESAPDFRLDTNHRRDRRIERCPGTDIEKQINQAADENGNCCLDDDDSHNALFLVQFSLY